MRLQNYKLHLFIFAVCVILLSLTVRNYFVDTLNNGLSPAVGLVLVFIYMALLIILSLTIVLTRNLKLVNMTLLIFLIIGGVSGALSFSRETILSINGMFSLRTILMCILFYFLVISFYFSKNDTNTHERLPDSS